jgi:hypothetical protein
MGPTPAHPAGRLPNDPRYIFASTIGVLLVAAEAARGVRLDRRGMLVVYGIAAMALATNLTLLRQGGAALRGAATATRTHLTAVEVGGGRLGTRLRTELGAIPFAGGEGNILTGYISAERKFGSPAFSLAELHTQSANIRQTVDGDLANTYGIHLQPASGPVSHCRRVTTAPGEAATTLKLPPGGAVLETSGNPAPVTLRRFGTAFTVQAGTLQPGAQAALPIPRDSAPDPWYASTTTGPLTVCGPPSA